MDPLAFDPSVAFVGIETFDGFLFARGPHAPDLGEFGLFADAQMDQAFVGAEVSFAVAQGGHPEFVVGFDPQDRADRIAFAEGTDEFPLDEMVCARGSIFEQRRGSVQVGGHQIGFSVDVVIEGLEATSDPLAIEVGTW